MEGRSVSPRPEPRLLRGENKVHTRRATEFGRRGLHECPTRDVEQTEIRAWTDAGGDGRACWSVNNGRRRAAGMMAYVGLAVPE